MANYLLSYHGGSTPESPVDQAKVMKDWTDWFGGLGKAVADGGNPTATSKTVNADGTVSDGGGANPVTGYSILMADNLDSAVAMAKGCPIVASGGSIEVSEILAMN
jgi:hypothetical protein